MDLIIFNKNLEIIGIFDGYSSLIWASRFWDVGDCEVYAPASLESLRLLSKGNYIARADDDMVCEIKSVELTTSDEDGNFITAHGYSTQDFLDRRIIWGTEVGQGKVEAFMRRLVRKSLGADASASRKAMVNGMNRVGLGTLKNYDDLINEQVSYKNIGEKIREYCRRFGMGYKMPLDSGVFMFEVYKGTDKSSSVVFAPKFENLVSSVYSKDGTNIGNAALIAGEGEGANRQKQEIGETEALERYEVFVDAKDLTKKRTYEQITAEYRGGSVQSSGRDYYYVLSPYDVPVVDETFKTWVTTNYPGGTIYGTGYGEYYRLSSAQIAKVVSATPATNSDAVLTDLPYACYLAGKGAESLAEYGEVTSFEGSIVPDVTFVYKKDFNLGDIVTVKTEFGVSAAVRITEVVEVWDDNGYSIEPSFEMISEV